MDSSVSGFEAYGFDVFDIRDLLPLSTHSKLRYQPSTTYTGSTLQGFSTKLTTCATTVETIGENGAGRKLIKAVHRVFGVANTRGRRSPASRG